MLKDSEWLKDRYSWVTKESGKMVPVQPDWSLIPGSKEIADLVGYQYWNSEDAMDTSEDQALLNLEELPEALQWPCVESGLLQIPLGLQKAAWKLDSVKSKDVKNKLKQKSLAKELRSRAKQLLAGKFQQRVAAQLKQMSLKQAASRITPMAGISAAKGKSLKAGLGKKVRKPKLKSMKKQAEDKAAKSLLTNTQDPPSDPPPLPPPEQPPEAAASAMLEASAGPLLGRKLRVVKLGHLCGKEGLCEAYYIVSGAITLMVGDKLQKVILPEAEVAAVQSAWLKPCKRKAMVLSRDLKQKILSACAWLDPVDGRV